PQDVILSKMMRPGAPVGLSMSVAQLNRHFRSERQAAYCTPCVDTAPYHRVQWMPGVVTMCHEHGCYLRTTCPGCDQAVGIADVTGGRCRRCSGRLGAAPIELVKVDSLEYKAQRVLHGWLHRDGTEEALGVPAEPVAEPMNALYYVLLAL